MQSEKIRWPDALSFGPDGWLVRCRQCPGRRRSKVRRNTLHRRLPTKYSAFKPGASKGRRDNNKGTEMNLDKSLPDLGFDWNKLLLTVKTIGTEFAINLRDRDRHLFCRSLDRQPDREVACSSAMQKARHGYDVAAIHVQPGTHAPDAVRDHRGYSDQLGFETTSLIALIGAAGLAVGLAIAGFVVQLCRGRAYRAVPTLQGR